jgi:hypothetical protein
MRWGRLSVENYRGVSLPRALGPILAAACAASTVWVAAYRHIGLAGRVAAGASLMVFLVGLVDDLAPYGPRGIRQHLRWLLEGRVTTGTLKLFVTLCCALMAVAAQPPKGGGWVAFCGVVLVAGAANIWNGLDVVPGRALKYFLVLGTWPILAAGAVADPAAAGVLAASVVALPLDLRERAMLGDSGSNLLGFTLGLCAYVVLPAWGVGLAAFAAVAFNVLADTIGFSTVIGGNAVLGWIDALGRRRIGPTQGKVPS